MGPYPPSTRAPSAQKRSRVCTVRMVGKEAPSACLQAGSWCERLLSAELCPYNVRGRHPVALGTLAVQGCASGTRCRLNCVEAGGPLARWSPDCLWISPVTRGPVGRLGGSVQSRLHGLRMDCVHGAAPPVVGASRLLGVSLSGARCPRALLLDSGGAESGGQHWAYGPQPPETPPWPPLPSGGLL